MDISSPPNYASALLTAIHYILTSHLPAHVNYTWPYYSHRIELILSGPGYCDQIVKELKRRYMKGINGCFYPSKSKFELALKHRYSLELKKAHANELVHMLREISHIVPFHNALAELTNFESGWDRGLWPDEIDAYVPLPTVYTAEGTSHNQASSNEISEVKKLFEKIRRRFVMGSSEEGKETEMSSKEEESDRDRDRAGGPTTGHVTEAHSDVSHNSNPDNSAPEPGYRIKRETSVHCDGQSIYPTNDAMDDVESGLSFLNISSQLLKMNIATQNVNNETGPEIVSIDDSEDNSKDADTEMNGNDRAEEKGVEVKVEPAGANTAEQTLQARNDALNCLNNRKVR